MGVTVVAMERMDDKQVDNEQAERSSGFLVPAKIATRLVQLHEDEDKPCYAFVILELTQDDLIRLKAEPKEWWDNYQKAAT